jgi:hypothetical protein
MRKLRLITAILIILTPRTSFAWNYTGHRVIASIAYRQLDEPTLQKIAEVLKKHPAYADLWANRPTNGLDDVLNLLWNASVFPDDARSEPWRRYGRSQAHYVNFRVLTDQGVRVEPPLWGENILNSYIAHLKQIQNPRTSIEDKALHLSWVFHQAGDIHQPLHAVARFSKALPEDDGGGNEVHVPNPRGHRGRGNNLHAYWDDLLGNDQEPSAVEKLADHLIRGYPGEEFADELARINIRDWAKESVQISFKTVHRDLDPEITTFAGAPIHSETTGEDCQREDDRTQTANSL